MATPDISAPHVMAFCQEHFPGGRARLVPVRPTPGAIPSECFPNVQHHIEKKGGRLVLGWHLWEIPGLLLEAEFHGVWESPKGGLVDITPTLPGFEEAKIVFVPRRMARLDPKTPDNLRCLLSDDPDLARMCELKAKVVELWNRAKPEPNGGPNAFSLSREDAMVLEAIQREHTGVMERLSERYPQMRANQDLA